MSAIVRIGSVSSDSGGDSPLTFDVKSKPDLSSCLRSAALGSLESIEIVVSSNELSELFDPLGIAGLMPSLKAGGSVAVRVVGDSSTDLGPVNTAFMLAGLNAESEKKEEGGARVLTARKSTAPTGQKKATSAKIRLNFPEEKKTADAPVKVTLDDLEDDDALIDEDDLLTDGAIAAPPTVDVDARAKAADDDCGGRTACDDCTCGRAETEAAEAAGEAKKEEVHESHCGNCFKGDAFRCASCPHLGKPAFKPGEEHLVLDLADDL